MKVRFFIAFIAVLTLSACASNAKHVPRHAKYQSVSYAVVVDTQSITIGGSNTGIGSYVGSSAAIYDATSNSFLGLVLRGLVGGVVGATLEEGATRRKGVSYTVEDTHGKIAQIASKNTKLAKGSCVKIVNGGRSYTSIEAADKSRCNSLQLANQASTVL